MNKIIFIIFITISMACFGGYYYMMIKYLQDDDVIINDQKEEIKEKEL